LQGDWSSDVCSSDLGGLSRLSVLRRGRSALASPPLAPRLRLPRLRLSPPSLRLSRLRLWRALRLPFRLAHTPHGRPGRHLARLRSEERRVGKECCAG